MTSSLMAQHIMTTGLLLSATELASPPVPITDLPMVVEKRKESLASLPKEDKCAIEA